LSVGKAKLAKLNQGEIEINGKISYHEAEMISGELREAIESMKAII